MQHVIHLFQIYRNKAMDLQPKQKAEAILKRIAKERKLHGNNPDLDLAEEMAREVIKANEWLQKFTVRVPVPTLGTSVPELEKIAFDVKTEDKQSIRAIRILIRLRDGK